MFRFAFGQAFPIVISYLFLGLAAGVLLVGAGYPPYFSTVSAMLIYGGSMQIVMVPMLTSHMPLWLVALMTLLVNGRYLFYGISLVYKYKDMGKLYPYMVFSTTDETYSLQCSLKIPDGFDKRMTRFLIQVICHSSWIIGCSAGAFVGAALPFDLTGIEFTATALFVVIAVDQWRSAKTHIPAIIGMVSSVVFYLTLGADNFILPALAVSAVSLMLMRDRIEMKKGGGKNE